MRLRLLQAKDCHSLCPFPFRSHCLTVKLDEELSQKENDQNLKITCILSSQAVLSSHSFASSGPI